MSHSPSGRARRGVWTLGALALLAAAPSDLHVTRTADRAHDTGRIEGRVRDTQGTPIMNAQVLIVGTALAAQTNAHGYYTIDKVPEGAITMRAAFVGYQPVEVIHVRVRARQTVTQDFALEKRDLQVQEMAVVAATQPLVPRDEVTTKQRIDGEFNRAPGAEFGHAPSGIVPPAPRGARDGEPNTEEYRRIYESRFFAARTAPLSTFSIDVDRASYANVRRFLQSGRLPPADAVRIEELLNYFDYAYAEPAGPHPFAVYTDLAAAPWNPRHRLVRIALQAKHLPAAKLPPCNLVFLIDVSGSMNSPDKLPLVRDAFRMLVPSLRREDRVAIVVYAGAAGLVLPSTTGDRKDEILAAIDRLAAGGSTAGGAGLQLAYDIAKEHFVPGGTNRVILATDGDFNVGPSSEGELVRLVEDRRRDGTALTVLGFGTGNYKDARMESLADKGNGNYAYVDGAREARKVFVEELGGTLTTVAKDVKLQVEFNPSRVQAYRLIGYENRALATEDFADDAKDAGELGAGHSVTALYEIVPAGVESDVALPQDPGLRYQAAPAAGDVGRPTRHADEWLTVTLRYKRPDGGPSRAFAVTLRDHDELRTAAAMPRGDFAWAAAVAEFGMLLRDSEFKGGATWQQVTALAGQGRSADGSGDRDGYRAEFLRLVETARALATPDVARTGSDDD